MLTADPGTWTGTGPLTMEYQWQRCDFYGNNCVDIAGATDDTYTLTDEDTGHTIKVVVTACNAAGSADAPAPATAAVAGRPDPDADADADRHADRRPRRPRRASPRAPTSGARRPRPPSSGPRRATRVGGFVGGDLGNVPASLVSDTSCQQLAGNSKYSRLKVRASAPCACAPTRPGPGDQGLARPRHDQISHGKAKKVTYKLDGKR